MFIYYFHFILNSLKSAKTAVRNGPRSKVKKESKGNGRKMKFMTYSEVWAVVSGDMQKGITPGFHNRRNFGWFLCDDWTARTTATETQRETKEERWLVIVNGVSFLLNKSRVCVCRLWLWWVHKRERESVCVRSCARTKLKQMRLKNKVVLKAVSCAGRQDEIWGTVVICHCAPRGAQRVAKSKSVGHIW